MNQCKADPHIVFRLPGVIEGREDRQAQAAFSVGRGTLFRTSKIDATLNPKYKDEEVHLCLLVVSRRWLNCCECNLIENT